ncbi:hypothetical protein [Paenibacillus pinihumi]|uniref:hypothetical protein n=1 Tax=Paenibacillus pinihumi TaxID=669462 RepID=UPI00040CFAE9|nr:hypothetical protein [Paenibacillus pinihumi]
MILGNYQYTRTPVAQHFMWVADYYDHTSLTEFDLNTQHPNNFYTIDRNKLVRFGLIGSGSQIFFDIADGIFELNRHRISVTYSPNSKEEYPLTGRNLVYQDIIAYKDAVADANLLKQEAGGMFNQQITAFNVGYKKQLEFEGICIHYQNILTVPANAPAFMQIKLTSEQALEGKLNIRVNGRLAACMDAPLQANVTGSVNWQITS